MADPIYEFGEFQLDRGRFELLRNGKALRVERKPMELLILLASRPGQLVTRTEIAERLWSSEVFVDTEHGINTAVRKLRYLLHDDPDAPKFIQTVTGMGYRFVAPINHVERESTEAATLSSVEVEENTASKPEAGGQVASVKQAAARRWWIPAAVVAAIPMAVAGWYLSRPLPPPRITTYAQLTHDGKRKWVAGTDGSRIYLFLQSGTDPIGQISVSGGEVVRIPIAMRSIGMAGLMDVSPDGSNFLVLSNENGFSDARPVWNVRMPRARRAACRACHPRRAFRPMASWWPTQ